MDLSLPSNQIGSSDSTENVTKFTCSADGNELKEDMEITSTDCTENRSANNNDNKSLLDSFNVGNSNNNEEDNKQISGNNNPNQINYSAQNQTINNTPAGTELKPFRCFINAERLNQLRKKVEDAIKERRTFTIKGGFQNIRKALLHRGWIEKIDIRIPLKNTTISTPPSMDEVCLNLPPKQEWETTAAHLAKCEKMIISRLLQNHDVDFYWNMRRDGNEWHQRLNKNKIINRFSRSLFTSKEGLCLLLQQMYWHTEPGVAYVRFPRCYTINFADQCTTFIEDFRVTACISLLKWFIEKLQNEGELSICNSKGKIPVTVIKFAIDRCNEYIAVQRHVDLDEDFHKIWDHEWDQFLTNFDGIIHKGETFEDNGCYSLYAFLTHAKTTLKNITPFWPQMELDGYKNIWIMKPGNKCRGRDIQLIKDVNDVVKVMNHKLKYVVQKYIEKPLLIHKTKFDIRQWFLITSVQPLTVWMYRDCYLRFSTQKFSLDSFHESVHLTNHAVQHKYTSQDRDSSLPEDNMWDNHTFKAYLRQIGHAEKWYKVIYPGMRESIIGAMLASQDTMDRRPNTFELYGADFMIAENFTPWLIEINSCPAMGPTTSVTSRMCPQCFEDLVKVVVDRRRDPKSDTGLFEMVYKQNLPQTPAYLGMTLSIRGKRIFKKRSSGKHKSDKKDKEKSMEINQNKLITKSICKSGKPKLNFEAISDYHGPVIGNLIEELHDTLFRNTIEDMEQTVPAAPPVSLLTNGIAPIPNRNKSPGVQDMRPVTQKATVSAYKQKSNKNILFNRKSNSTKENKLNIAKTNQDTQHLGKNEKNIPNYSSKQFNAWKTNLEQTFKNSKIFNSTWEQDTASILNNKTDFIKKPDSNCLINSYNFSAIKHMLPDIESKSSVNLFTVGLGYNKNYYNKPAIKESIILPMGTSKSVTNCHLKI